jgi:hypothetical protein
MSISNSATGLRPGVVTSTTRPTTPYTGQIIYETDTGYLRVWDGAAWDYLSQSQDTTTNFPVSGISGAWTSYTPTLAGGATVATTSIAYAKYIQIQKLVIVQLSLAITGSGAGGGIWSCTYPTGLAPANNSGWRPLGTITYLRPGVAFYNGSAVVYAPTAFAGLAHLGSNFMGASQPTLTITSGDRFEAQLMYEVA